MWWFTMDVGNKSITWQKKIKNTEIILSVRKNIEGHGILSSDHSITYLLSEVVREGLEEEAGSYSDFEAWLTFLRSYKRRRSRHRDTIQKPLHQHFGILSQEDWWGQGQTSAVIVIKKQVTKKTNPYIISNYGTCQIISLLGILTFSLCCCILLNRFVFM